MGTGEPRIWIGLLVGCLLSLSGPLAGCATSGAIPKQLEAQVDKSVTFDQLKESPTAYQGRLVVLGGEVLGAKRSKGGTEIQVLQIPLGASHQPELDRSASQGRFLAVHKDFLDPATLPPGTRITVVGEVVGSATQRLDETEYRYPVVEIKHLATWDERSQQVRRYWRPGIGIYGSGGWGGWGAGGGIGFGIGF